SGDVAVGGAVALLAVALPIPLRFVDRADVVEGDSFGAEVIEDAGEIARVLVLVAGLEVGRVGAGIGVGMSVAGHAGWRRVDEGQELRDAAFARRVEEPALVPLAAPVVDTFRHL